MLLTVSGLNAAPIRFKHLWGRYGLGFMWSPGVGVISPYATEENESGLIFQGSPLSLLCTPPSRKFQIAPKLKPLP
jgi:hypothetical protein